MSKFKNITYKALISAIAISMLTSCSGNGEPSDSEIYKAVVAYTNKNPMSAVFAVQILSTKKLSCTKVGSNEFICLVEAVATANLTGQVKNIERYRFVKGTSGWTMLENIK
jgi:hypothetical protein